MYEFYNFPDGLFLLAFGPYFIIEVGPVKGGDIDLGIT